MEAKVADSPGDSHFEAIVVVVTLALASVFPDLVPSPWFLEPRALGRWPLVGARLWNAGFWLKAEVE